MGAKVGVAGSLIVVLLFVVILVLPSVLSGCDDYGARTSPIGSFEMTAVLLASPEVLVEFELLDDSFLKRRRAMFDFLDHLRNGLASAGIELDVATLKSPDRVGDLWVDGVYFERWKVHLELVAPDLAGGEDDRRVRLVARVLEPYNNDGSRRYDRGLNDFLSAWNASDLQQRRREAIGRAASMLPSRIRLIQPAIAVSPPVS